jgi:rod shape-determining protein MreD
MNRIASIIFLALLSFIFIILQTTLFAPNDFGLFYPDLSLIFIVFLALFSETRGGAIIALGNAYMTDVLSGYMFGIHTFSRLAVYTTLKGFSESVYSQTKLAQVIAIFFSTIFSWFFIWAVLKTKTDIGFDISLGGVMVQGVMNILIGFPVFWIIKKAYARIQA